jgi:hypothetical protein
MTDHIEDFFAQLHDLPLRYAMEQFRQKKTNELRLWHDNGLDIVLRREEGQHPRESSLYIAVTSTTTIEQIREAWHWLSQIRDMLTEFQPHPPLTLIGILKQIAGNFSYKWLASFLNVFIEERVVTSWQLMQADKSLSEVDLLAKMRDEVWDEVQGVPRLPRTKEEWDQNSSAQGVCAMQAMEFFGIKQDAALEHIERAFENLDAGNPAFEADYPVEWTRVRERLRRPPKNLDDSRFGYFAFYFLGELSHWRHEI